MRILNILVCCLMVGTVCSAASVARGEDTKQTPFDSLMGKYEGRLQIHNSKQSEYDYQVKIVPVDRSANSFSLESFCQNCETKVWKRNNCRITDEKEVVKFTCKGKTFDEEYTSKDDKLRGEGHTSKWLYSISVTKVVK